LAARGRTTYTIRDGQVVVHDEQWITKKTDVLKRLFFG
jgi:hypothetical protein